MKLDLTIHKHYHKPVDVFQLIDYHKPVMLKQFYDNITIIPSAVLVMMVINQLLNIDLYIINQLIDYHNHP